jgi:protein-S-isoprenylcysteine O-methyltransferase Ste14
LVASRLAASLAVLGLVLFVPAGTLSYWNAWLYLAALLLPMLFTLVYLYRNDPALLRKRLTMREKEREQKTYVALSLIFFLAAFVLPGLDFRFGWSRVPPWLVFAAVVVMEAGYTMFVAVMRQNSYASRVIEIQEGQKLIDSGMYSVVRHPLYLAATLLYAASPLILGSWFALIPMAALPVLLGYRIVNEEKVLRAGLAGYEEYMERVRYRLVPFLW